MAIAKMKKVMLIAPNPLKDSLLNAVQELQSLELIAVNDSQVLLREQQSSAQTIVNLQKQLDDVTTKLAFLSKYVKQSSTFQQLRSKKEQYTLQELQDEVAQWDAAELLAQVEQYQQRLREQEERLHDTREKETLLRKWAVLDFHPKEIFKHPFTKTKMGTIPQTSDNSYLRLLEESDEVVVKEIYHTREEIGVLVTYPKNHAQVAKELLAQAHFSIVWYSFEHQPKDELAANLDLQKQLVALRKEIHQQLQEEQVLLRQLRLTSEVLYNELQREKAKEQLYSGEHLCCLHGYLTQEAVELTRQQLVDYQLDEQVTLVELEIDSEEYEEVPTVLHNHRLIAPFEMMIEMYGLPKYGEVDPTPATAPFYLVFFGMMAADIGYGLILWLATAASLKFFHFDKGMKRSLKFFHLLSYPTIIWGIIFGSFFGVDLPFQPLSLSRDLSTIMVLSIIFGIIQIMVGLSIGAYSNLKKRQYADAITSHIGWLTIIIGIILYIVGTMIVNIPIVATIGSYVAVIAAVLIVVTTIITSENKFGGLAAGLYNLYGISGYVGDVVSYTRLMALAVSGGSIASAFNMLVSFLPPAARFTVGILLIVALHGLNIFLSFLGAYVHGLRLQFVEFYGKFYEGGGRALNPLKPSNTYVDITTKKQASSQHK